MLKFLPLLGLLAFAACSSAKPLADIGQITHNDLQTAIKMAQNASPPDTEAVTCFTFLDGQLTALQGQVNSAVAPAGLVSAFELGHLGVNVVVSGLSPAQKQAIDIACGPYALNVAGGINSLVMQFGGPALIH